MSKDVSRIRQAGDIIKKSNHLQSGPRGAANEREKGGCVIQGEDIPTLSPHSCGGESRGEKEGE